MIIFRYLVKELSGTFLLTSIVLLFIVISTQFAHYLTLTAAGKMLGWQLLYLLALEIPQLLTLILPLAFYLSILLTYGRLYGESEIVVLRACGVSREKLLLFSCVPALFIALSVGAITLWLNPHIAITRNKLLNRVSAISILQTLLPGRFQAAQGGKQIFYVQSTSRDHQQLKNIFLAQQNGFDTQTQRPLWTITTAKTGHYETIAATQAHFIIADQGNRYEGEAGKGKFNLIHFDQYGLNIDLPLPLQGENKIDSTPTLKLFRAPSITPLAASAELQWRLSLPLSTLILTLLAFSLAEVSPRQGKFARFFPAILIYIIYANFMLMGQSWIIHGKLSPYLGLSIVHLGLITLGMTLYARGR